MRGMMVVEVGITGYLTDMDDGDRGDTVMTWSDKQRASFVALKVHKTNLNECHVNLLI